MSLETQGRELATEIADAQRSPGDAPMLKLGTIVSIAAGPPPLATVTIDSGNVNSVALLNFTPAVGDSVWIVQLGAGRWICLGTQQNTAGGGIGVLPGLKSGRYYSPHPEQPLTTVTSVTQSRLYCLPIYLPAGVTLDRIAAENSTTVASASFRMGIYRDSGSMYPGALLLDAGTISIAASAQLQAITINQAISAAGWYWLALVCQGGAGTPQMLGYSGGGSVGGGFGMPHDSTATMNSGITLAYRQASVTGALPDPFTSTVNTIQTNVPLIGVRAA